MKGNEFESLLKMMRRKEDTGRKERVGIVGGRRMMRTLILDLIKSQGDRRGEEVRKEKAAAKQNRSSI